MKQIIKRDGRQVNFDARKIENAVLKCFQAVDGEITRYAREKAFNIAMYIEENCKDGITVEEIQDLVEHGLMSCARKDVARAYISYRNERTKARGNSIDKTIEEYLDGKNEYWNNENSNKNAKIVTTQRDYLAGITSTDYARRFLLAKDICEAHDAGIIHQHDIDYMAQMALNNCSLINLNDMLQNGTVINGVMIEKPHKFLTASTIATQIILGVSSSQYGGCTVSLAHLAPFVRDSFNYYKKEVKKEFEDLKYNIENNKIEEIAMKRLKKEIEAGVQTFNYQVNSMTNTNGQSPFLSVVMWVGENSEYEKENALIIEEFLKQRIQGMKNEKGVYITIAFPKLLYVLDENNTYEGSKYFYLTKLAAQCTAKRMVPDYISAKKMREYKNGDVYGCMGCRSFLTPDRCTENYAKALDYDQFKGHKYYGRFNMRSYYN